MTSHYRNTIFAVYLLFGLLATSWSAPSFIRQSTDHDFIQQNYQDISSRDSKISSSETVMGSRNRPPSSYSLKMESFNTLLESTTERYESRPFPVGGYNWTLVVYPKGNTKDGGSGYLSLYVAIDNLNSVAEIYADLRFYIFNKKERNYFTIQDTDVWRFSAFKKMWGFSQVLSVDTFKDPKNGYLYDGDHCEFGVDVTIPSLFDRSEVFSVANNFVNPKFTWKITGFSTLFGLYYVSDHFSVGGRTWKLNMYPNGYAAGTGKDLWLSLNAVGSFKPYEKIYVRGELRVLNQRKFSDNEGPIDHWYDGTAYFSVDFEFMPLADLRDPSKGFIVNDTMIVEVELEAISSTKYFPS